MCLSLPQRVALSFDFPFYGHYLRQIIIATGGELAQQARTNKTGREKRDGLANRLTHSEKQHLDLRALVHEGANEALLKKRQQSETRRHQRSKVLTEIETNKQNPFWSLTSSLAGWF